MKDEFDRTGYVEFDQEILDSWKSKGYKHVKSEVIDHRSMIECIIELSPFEGEYDFMKMLRINSNELSEYARYNTPMYIFLVKEANI